MLSSDKNIESLGRLIETLKDYIGLQAEYLKLDVVEKFVRLATVLAVGAIMLVLALAVVFYLSFAMVYWLEPATGVACAFAIVAAVLLLLLLIVYALRKPLIMKPLVKFIASILLSK